MKWEIRSPGLFAPDGAAPCVFLWLCIIFALALFPDMTDEAAALLDRPCEAHATEERDARMAVTPRLPAWHTKFRVAWHVLCWIAEAHDELADLPEPREPCVARAMHLFSKSIEELGHRFFREANRCAFDLDSISRRPCTNGLFAQWLRQHVSEHQGRIALWHAIRCGMDECAFQPMYPSPAHEREDVEWY